MAYLENGYCLSVYHDVGHGGSQEGLDDAAEEAGVGVETRIGVCFRLLLRGPMLLWQQLVPGDLMRDQLTGPPF